jgi:integrase
VRDRQASRRSRSSERDTPTPSPRFEPALLDVVSRQLGHASIATTANIYLHDADDSANEVAELLATVFDARGGNLGE